MPHTDVNFVKALGWANEKHKEDYRKGTDIPYFSHLMSVCALVMESGGNAEECIAALLHDVVEDNPNVEREDVAKEFGERVAEIVIGLSDASAKTGEEKPPWKARKEKYLEHLRNCDDASIILVSNADKLHNARSILIDLTDPEIGEKVWDRFSATREQSLWYYKSLLEIYKEKSPAYRLVRELNEVIDRLQN